MRDAVSHIHSATGRKEPSGIILHGRWYVMIEHINSCLPRIIYLAIIDGLLFIHATSVRS